MKRRYLVLAILLLILAVLGFLLFGGHDYRRELEAYKKDLIAHGEKLTMLELAPSDTNDPGPAKQFMAFMSNCFLPTSLPEGMKMVEPGRARVLHTQSTQADMLGYETNKSNVAVIHSLIDGKKLNFALGYRKAGQLLYGTTIQALDLGDASEAFQDLLTGVDLLNPLAPDHVLVTDLVRLTLVRIAFAATWEFLQDNRWTDQQLARLQSAWQQNALPGIASQSLRIERAFIIDSFDKYRKLPNGSDLLQALPGTTRPWDVASDINVVSILGAKITDWYNDYPRFWKWRQSWSYEEELVFLKQMTIVLQAVDMQRQNGSFEPAFTRMKQSLDNFNAAGLYHTNHTLFTYDAFQVLTKYISKAADIQAAITLTYSAIALERYHLAHNAYPEKLDQLVPAYIEKVPIDFMDGKPLRYSLRKDGTFLLYSVGENGIDDGGDPSGGMPDWTKGLDIVWPTAITTNASPSAN